jgi:tetratricopeptide (TPR) repeat protein
MALLGILLVMIVSGQSFYSAHNLGFANATAEPADSNEDRMAHRYLDLARLYSEQDRFIEAIPLYEKAIAIFKTTHGLESAAMAYALHCEGCCYGMHKDYKKSQELLTRTIEVSTKARGAKAPDTLLAWMNLAYIYEHQGKYPQAEFILNRYLPLLEKTQAPALICCLGNLGELYRDRGQYSQAEPLVLRALALDEKYRSAHCTSVAYKLDSLAQIYQAQGRLAEAEPLYKKALSMSVELAGANHSQTVQYREHYASLMKATHR